MSGVLTDGLSRARPNQSGTPEQVGPPPGGCGEVTLVDALAAQGRTVTEERLVPLPLTDLDPACHTGAAP